MEETRGWPPLEKLVKKVERTNQEERSNNPTQEFAGTILPLQFH